MSCMTIRVGGSERSSPILRAWLMLSERSCSGWSWPGWRCCSSSGSSDRAGSERAGGLTVRRRVDELPVGRASVGCLRDRLGSHLGEGPPSSGWQDGKLRSALEIIHEDRLVDIDRRLESEVAEFLEPLLGTVED